MRTINGLHREGKGYSWDWEESLKITDPLGGTTMLDVLLTDVENGWWYPQLRRELGPQHLIHIRMYPETGWTDPKFGRHWNEIKAWIWADECMRRLTDERLRYNGLLPIDDPYVIVSFANEQDLQIEGHPDAATMADPSIDIDVYRQMFRWSAAVRREFKHLRPDHGCKLGTDPLAGGHDVRGYPPDYEYQLPEFKDLLGLCDVILLHAYFFPDGTGCWGDNEGFWHGIRCCRPPGYREHVQGYAPIGGIPDPGGVAMQYPSKPFAVTEFGNFRHFDSSDTSVNITMQGYNKCYEVYSQTGRCALVTPFLWNSGDEHRENRIRGNWPLTRALQQMQRYPACEWPYQQTGGNEMATFRLGNIDIVDLRDALAVHATLKYDWRLMQAIKRIVIHHSATSVTATAEQFARYHVDRHGWPGIGYHFVVTANGEIQYVNDHTLITYGVADQNGDTVHICLVGDFTDATPPEAQLVAARTLIANYRHAMGQMYPVVGHRDIAQSECPGNTWPQWKARLVTEAPPAELSEVESLRAQLAAANQRNLEHTSIVKTAISMLEKIK